MICFFFLKQKTAYEMRISDWSSDVCSSDLLGLRRLPSDLIFRAPFRAEIGGFRKVRLALPHFVVQPIHRRAAGAGEARKTVVQGKSVSVRVDLGGLRSLKNTTTDPIIIYSYPYITPYISTRYYTPIK